MRTDAGSIDRGTGPDRLPWLLLGVTAMLVFFVGVSERQMHGTAAFYASVSRQITETGVWLPLHNGPVPYFLKPPLLFWLSAIAMEGLGPTNLAASLWPRLFGIGCVALTALIARRAYGEVAGVLAGLVCVANPTLIETANSFRLDTALLFWILLSVWALLAPSGRWRPPVFYGAMALAVLSKGPQGYLPLALAAVHLLASRRRPGWRAADPRARRAWLAWAPLLALPALYYADHLLRFGTDYLIRVAGDADMREVAGPLDHLLRALERNFLTPFVRWLPFSPFMVLGLWRTAGRLRHRPATGDTNGGERALDWTLVA
ncbi:MAG: ArnT family glycosyltransferase, partial [Myxococcota bacterium]